MKSQLQKFSISDFLFMVLTVLYLWDWGFHDLTISRVLAVVVLTVWWTLFFVRLFSSRNANAE